MTSRTCTIAAILCLAILPMSACAQNATPQGGTVYPPIPYQAPGQVAPTVPAAEQPVAPLPSQAAISGLPSLPDLGTIKGLGDLPIPRSQLNEIGIDDQTIAQMMSIARNLMSDPNVAALMKNLGGAANLPADPNRLLQQLLPTIQGMLIGGNLGLGDMGPNQPGLAGGAINPAMLAPNQGIYSGLDDLLR